MSETRKTVNDAAFEILNAQLNIGDRVRIVAKIDEGVHGSKTVWTSRMNDSVGQFMTIRGVEPEYGAFQLDNYYWYPAVALDTQVHKVTVNLPDYCAEITKEGVNVGCQNLTKEMILQIVQGALDVGFLDAEDIESLKV